MFFSNIVIFYLSIKSSDMPAVNLVIYSIDSIYISMYYSIDLSYVEETGISGTFITFYIFYSIG